MTRRIPTLIFHALGIGLVTVVTLPTGCTATACLNGDAGCACDDGTCSEGARCVDGRCERIVGSGAAGGAGNEAGMSGSGGSAGTSGSGATSDSGGIGGSSGTGGLEQGGVGAGGFTAAGGADAGSDAASGSGGTPSSTPDAQAEGGMAHAPDTGVPATECGPCEGTCYVFQAHGGGTAVDGTPYAVAVGEQRVTFRFDVPWAVPSVIESVRTLQDASSVLMAWTLASHAVGSEPVTEVDAGLSMFDTGELVAAWGKGGQDIEPPEGVTLEAPAPNSALALTWHYLNESGSPVSDRSGVGLCMHDRSAVDEAKIADATLLGTEDFGLSGLAPGSGEVSGTCQPGRNGSTFTGDITVVAYQPHMHELGVDFTLTRGGSSGTAEVFTSAFDFHTQDPVVATTVLADGDTLTTTCRYNNTRQSTVSLGAAISDEQCFVITYAYPVGMLENDTTSLLASSSTCL